MTQHLHNLIMMTTTTSFSGDPVEPRTWRDEIKHDAFYQLGLILTDEDLDSADGDLEEDEEDVRLLHMPTE